jgi:hypothetical protein
MRFDIEAVFDVGNNDPILYLDQLYEAGLQDCLIGAGIHGKLGLDCTRIDTDKRSAKVSLIQDVKKVFPEAKLERFKIYGVFDSLTILFYSMSTLHLGIAIYLTILGSYLAALIFLFLSIFILWKLA